MLKLSAKRARAAMREEELTELDEQEFQYNMDDEFPAPDFATLQVLSMTTCSVCYSRI
jgi:hypothetical protein